MKKTPLGFTLVFASLFLAATSARATTGELIYRGTMSTLPSQYWVTDSSVLDGLPAGAIAGRIPRKQQLIIDVPNELGNDSGHPYTFVLKIRLTDDLAEDACLLTMPNTPYKPLIYVGRTDRKVHIRQFNQDSDSAVSSSAIQAGRWTVVAVAFGSNTTDIYMDGDRVYSGNATLAGSYADSTRFTNHEMPIGTGDESDGYNSFYFADVRIYEGAVAVADELPGTGVMDDPFLIASVADWELFVSNVNRGMALGANIPCYRLETNLGSASAPITQIVGTDAHHFRGDFDGGSNTIHIALSGDDQGTALFARIDKAFIYNLKVSGTVVSSADYAAALVGFCGSETNMIQHCDISANVTVAGADHAGGIIGHGGSNHTLLIYDCVFSGTISGFTEHAGGLLGWCDALEALYIGNCLFKGAFSPGSSGKYHPIACKSSDSGFPVVVTSNTETSAGTTIYYLNTVTPSASVANIVVEGRPVSATYVPILWEESVTPIDGNVYYAQTATILTPETGYVRLESGDLVSGTGGPDTHVVIEDGATVTLYNVCITNITAEHVWAGITCRGDATIILQGDNYLCGGDPDISGIFVFPDKTLTIRGDGTLHASSHGTGAGIGGGNGPNMACGNIVIEGGNVTARGGGGAAGIGSGMESTCGTITISGGTVTATGGKGGAGIGGGSLNATCGDITISGGSVSATSGGGAAGIGSGAFATCGDITITGGIVIATGTTTTLSGATLGGAGIGNGYSSDCGNIAISGGDVTATGSPFSAGIGGSSISNNGTMTISGGTVIASGGQWAAGIGGGFNSTNDTITVSGGTVTASGGEFGAGIGGGAKGTCGDIVLEETVTLVTATHGQDCPNAVGAGVGGSCGTMTVSGTEVGNITTNPYVYPCITTIASQFDWDLFASRVNRGIDDYNGKTVTLAADITISTMVGTTDHPFRGTFAGGGHELKADITSSETSAAPFRQIDGATITNLTVTGTVTSTGRHAAGLVGGCGTNGPNAILDCTVATSVNGSGCAGGIVGHGGQGTLTIERCVFSGTISGFDTCAGGLLGWCDALTLTIRDCLFKGSFSPSDSGKIHPVACKDGNSTVAATVERVYYLNTIAPTTTGNNLVSGADGVPVSARLVDGEWDLPITAADGLTYYGQAAQTVTYWDPVGETSAECAVYAPYAGENTLTSGWWVVSGAVTNETRITVSGDVNLILVDGATLTAPKGIEVTGGNSLWIWAQSTGDAMGRLFAGTTSGDDRTCDDHLAAIGGGNETWTGAIMVNGGRLNVYAGDDAAGIGGGYRGSAGKITVNGGDVTARSHHWGAAIGSGGGGGRGGTITITGGAVSAISGPEGAAIGGSDNRSVDKITITGGTVTATACAGAQAIGDGMDGPGDGNPTSPLSIPGMKAGYADDNGNVEAWAVNDERMACCRNTAGKTVLLKVCYPHEYDGASCRWCGLELFLGLESFVVRKLYDGNYCDTKKLTTIELAVYSEPMKSPDARGSCLTYLIAGDGIDLTDNLDDGGEHRRLNGVHDIEQANHFMATFNDDGWAYIKAGLTGGSVLLVTGEIGPYNPSYESEAPNGKDKRMTLTTTGLLAGQTFYVIERDPGYYYEPTGYVYEGNDADADPRVDATGMNVTQMLYEETCDETDYGNAGAMVPEWALYLKDAATGRPMTVFVVNRTVENKFSGIATTVEDYDNLYDGLGHELVVSVTAAEEYEWGERYALGDSAGPTNGWSSVKPVFTNVCDVMVWVETVVEGWSMTTSAAVRITSAPLTITAKDQTYGYNGQPQGEDHVTYDDPTEIAAKVEVRGLVAGDGLAAVTLDGTRSETGTCPIIPSGVTVTNATGDVTFNYDIGYTNGTLTIRTPPPPPVASLAVNGGAPAGYPSLHEALAAAAAASGTNKTITLLANISSATEGTANELEVADGLAVTLDLNGQIIDLSGISGRTISVSGDMTLQDSGSDTAHSGSLPNGGLILGGLNGVEIQSGGKVTMNGGTISGNDTSGVHFSGESFELSGGSISGNDQCGIVADAGSLVMSGGTISGNPEIGVSVEGTGSFTMSGGEIAGNNVVKLGVNLVGTQFTMTGGTISGHSGDGVKLQSGAVFTLGSSETSAGTVSGNLLGVDVINGTFNLDGGSVTGSAGPGVTLNVGTVNLSGGSITGNAGTGLLVNSDGTVTLSGAPNVTGNGEGNVNLPQGKTITVTGSLTDGDKQASVGVTLAEGYGVITSDLDGLSETSAKGGVSNFSSDAGGYTVGLNAAGEAILGYSVSFDPNGAESGAAPADAAGYPGSPVTAPDNTGGLTKTGYHFTGWNIEPEDFTVGTHYDAGAEIPVSEDTTVYAEWIINSYRVKFDANTTDSSLSGTMADQPFTYGVEQALTTNTYTRAEYLFTGWNTVAEPTETEPGTAFADTANVKNLTEVHDGEVTLYAQWTIAIVPAALDLSLTVGPWGHAEAVVGGETNLVAGGTSTNLPVAYGAAVTVTAVPDAGFAVSGEESIEYSSFTNTAEAAFAFLPNPVDAAIHWKYSSAIGRYFAQVSIPAHAGYAEALEDLSILFADRTNAVGEVYAQLWDAAARAPQPVLLTDNGVAYRGVTLGAAAFDGLAEGDSALWGVSDEALADAQLVVPAGERLIGLYVRKRVNPVSGNETAGEVENFISYLTWMTNGTRYYLPVVENGATGAVATQASLVTRRSSLVSRRTYAPATLGLAATLGLGAEAVSAEPPTARIAAFEVGGDGSVAGRVEAVAGGEASSRFGAAAAVRILSAESLTGLWTEEASTEVDAETGAFALPAGAVEAEGRFFRVEVETREVYE